MQYLRLPFNHLSLLLLLFLSCPFIRIASVPATAAAAATVGHDKDEDNDYDDNDDEQHKNDFGLAAYFPDYRFGDNNGGNLHAAAPHLTDLLLFSIQPHKSGRVRGVCCLQDQHYDELSSLLSLSSAQQQNRHDHPTHAKDEADSSLQRIWVTIGGAGRAEAIPTITKSTTKRQRLIHAMVNLSQEHGIGGIDLDIYYPTSQEELLNYANFVKEASQAWHRVGLLVSVTWHPHRLQLPKPIFPLVDRVHLMAYDMVQTMGDYHSTLSDSQRAVQSLLHQGCEHRKIWLGIPMYGRKLNNPGEAETFGALWTSYSSSSQSSSSSPSSGTKADDSIFQHDGFEWDSPDRIRAKMDYAFAQELGGVFFWELGQDYQDPSSPGGILLEAASRHRNHLLSATTTTTTTTTATANDNEL
ncbi:MAG: hypothetical protein SGBAC_005911 [Bacillariaceae sp.]